MTSYLTSISLRASLKQGKKEKIKSKLKRYLRIFLRSYVKCQCNAALTFLFALIKITLNYRPAALYVSTFFWCHLKTILFKYLF